MKARRINVDFEFEERTGRVDVFKLTVKVFPFNGEPYSVSKFERAEPDDLASKLEWVTQRAAAAIKEVLKGE